MVTGMSGGSLNAQTTAHFFGPERVTAVGLHCSMMQYELIEQEGCTVNEAAKYCTIAPWILQAPVIGWLFHLMISAMAGPAALQLVYGDSKFRWECPEAYDFLRRG